MSGRTSISSNSTVIRNKVIHRIFCRDPTLNCVPSKLNIFLRRLTNRLPKRFAFGNQNLRADDIDPSHFFGDSMFNLNTRVYLDKEEFAGVHIHQKLDGAGTLIVDMSANAQTQITYLVTLFLCQIWGGSALDHFLVATLNGTIALPQMHEIAILIAKYLHFHVPCTLDQTLQIAFAFAECSFRFTTPFEHLLGQFIRAGDWAHATPSTTPRRFEH